MTPIACPRRYSAVSNQTVYASIALPRASDSNGNTACTLATGTIGSQTFDSDGLPSNTLDSNQVRSPRAHSEPRFPFRIAPFFTHGRRRSPHDCSTCLCRATPPLPGPPLIRPLTRQSLSLAQVLVMAGTACQSEHTSVSRLCLP